MRTQKGIESLLREKRVVRRLRVSILPPKRSCELAARGSAWWHVVGSSEQSLERLTCPAKENAANQATRRPGQRKIEIDQWDVPPPEHHYLLLEHANLSQSTTPCRTRRFPSAQRTQAALGRVSSQVGDHWRILGVDCFCFLAATVLCISYGFRCGLPPG